MRRASKPSVFEFNLRLWSFFLCSTGPYIYCVLIDLTLREVRVMKRTVSGIYQLEYVIKTLCYRLFQNFARSQIEKVFFKSKSLRKYQKARLLFIASLLIRNTLTRDVVCLIYYNFLIKVALLDQKYWNQNILMYR